MTDTTPSETADHADLARLEKLERTVRRLRRWLWVALIVAIALIAFGLGRASANRQMMNNPKDGMNRGAAMFNAPTPPPQQGPSNSGGPNMRGGDGRGGDGGGDGNDNDGKDKPKRGSREGGPKN